MDVKVSGVGIEPRERLVGPQLGRLPPYGGVRPHGSGRRQEARPLVLEALPTLERYFGPDHAVVVHARRLLV